MKILKGLLFLGILGLLVFVFKQMYQLEEIDSSQNSALLSEELTAKQFADSLRSIASFDTLKQADARLTAQIDDFDARIIYQGDTCVLEVKKSHRLIARRTWKYLRVSNLMCSDLNGNQNPEFWLYGSNKLNKIEFKAFEFSGAFVKVLSFPNLMGRQRFGYVGKDSLYFRKTMIVRSFQFKNDLYSDLGNGFRECYYSLGPDLSFVLTKTLDLKKIDE